MIPCGVIVSCMLCISNLLFVFSLNKWLQTSRRCCYIHLINDFMDLFIINLDLTRDGTDAAVETRKQKLEKGNKNKNKKKKKKKKKKKERKKHSSLLYKHEFGSMEIFIILLRT